MSLKKIIIAIFFIFVLIFSVFAINDKSYKNLTDRDRILLSISYYEVSQKYAKEGKKKLAASYLRQAIKIEKDVKKYASGELEIPKKTININLQDIFNDNEKSNNNNEKNNSSQTTNNTVEKKK